MAYSLFYFTLLLFFLFIFLAGHYARAHFKDVPSLCLPLSPTCTTPRSPSTRSTSTCPSASAVFLVFHVLFYYPRANVFMYIQATRDPWDGGGSHKHHYRMHRIEFNSSYSFLSVAIPASHTPPPPPIRLHPTLCTPPLTKAPLIVVLSIEISYYRYLAKW